MVLGPMRVCGERFSACIKSQNTGCNRRFVSSKFGVVGPRGFEEIITVLRSRSITIIFYTIIVTVVAAVLKMLLMKIFLLCGRGSRSHAS